MSQDGSIKISTATTIAVTGFLVGTAVTATIYTLILKHGRTKNDFHSSNRDSDTMTPQYESDMNGSRTREGAVRIPQEIRDEQLSRTTLYFSSDNMSSLANASVLVVGLGGVGSHAAIMLGRSGIGYIRLVDFDQVTLSSLNRHACATLADVGLAKVVCAQRFLRSICPDPSHMTVDARVQMYTGDPHKDGTLLTPPHNDNNNKQQRWDMVIDAIDDVPTKTRLLLHCIRHDIRVVSCMGAGGKSDVTRIHISDLRTASKDPLATKLRNALKKQIPTATSTAWLEDVTRLAVVYSSEKTVVPLADFTPEQQTMGMHKFGAMDQMRIRIMPVLSTMPAIMGQSLAAWTLCEIGNKPFSPMAGERIGRNVRHRMFQHFKNREKNIRNKLEKEHEDDSTLDNNTSTTTMMEKGERDWMMIGTTWVGPVQIDCDDVEYILSELWHNRCGITGQSFVGTVLELARWDASRPSDIHNIVVLSVSALQTFDDVAKQTGDGRNIVREDLRRRIERRLSQSY